MIQTVTKTQYKVGGYTYDDKALAEELDSLLEQTPDSRICPDCKGTRWVDYLTTERVEDEWGMNSGFRSVKKERCCTSCKNGIQTKKVTESWG